MASSSFIGNEFGDNININSSQAATAAWASTQKNVGNLINSDIFAILLPICLYFFCFFFLHSCSVSIYLSIATLHTFVSLLYCVWHTHCVLTFWLCVDDGAQTLSKFIGLYCLIRLEWSVRIFMLNLMYALTGFRVVLMLLSYGDQRLTRSSFSHPFSI